VPHVVLGCDKDRVIVRLANGDDGGVPHRDTDVLAAANTAYAAMSPAQRSLDAKTIAARADLWPSKVTALRKYKSGEGKEVEFLQPGTELDFGTFDGTWVRAKNPRGMSVNGLALHETDLVERVRAVLETKRAPAAHRVLSELHGKTVNLRTAKKANLNAKAPPEFVLLYFSASWCGPCREFSPKLVRFYEQNKKDAGKRFEIVWISRDHSEAEMQQYAKESGFPWLAVAWGKLGEIPIAQAHDVGGIPDLVMLDATGALVADSYVGREYQGADSVLDVLAARLKKK
jgi:nucleoredoxin